MGWTASPRPGRGSRRGTARGVWGVGRRGRGSQWGSPGRDSPALGGHETHHLEEDGLLLHHVEGGGPILGVEPLVDAAELAALRGHSGGGGIDVRKGERGRRTTTSRVPCAAHLQLGAEGLLELGEGLRHGGGGLRTCVATNAEVVRRDRKKSPLPNPLFPFGAQRVCPLPRAVDFCLETACTDQLGHGRAVAVKLARREK
jgi:hypothetical protein